MDEKEIIKGKPLPIIGIVLIVIGIISAIACLKSGGAFIPLLAFGIPGIIACIVTATSSIAVTDKRVSGKINLKTVDLPIDSISSVGKNIGRIVVATSSGKVDFGYLSNGNDVYKTISDLIVARQSK